MNSTISNFAALCSGVCLVALPGSAWAQGQLAAPEAIAAEQEVSSLEEIVVTARKRAESVQDIPVSVTAISAKQIERYDLTSIEKVAASTPQFSVGRASNGSGAQLTLRGIGSSQSSIGIEQSVAVVVDSVYYGQGRVINEGFFDLARLEILKGPQALFFGKNATAGVISITTADPTDKVEFVGRAGYEIRSQNLVGEAIGSGPLSDTLGIRVAVRASKMFGGLFENKARDQAYTSLDVATGAVGVGNAPAGARDVPGERELLGRLTLKWRPSDRLTNTLKVSGGRNENDNPAWNNVLYNCPSGSSQLDPVNACGHNFTIYQNNFPTQLTSLPFARADGGLYNIYKSYAVTDTLNYEMDDVTITSVSNYNWNRNRYACDCDFQSGTAQTFATENSSWRAFSSELRALTTYDGPVNLMVGGYYQKTKRKFDQWIASFGLDNSAAADPGNRYVAFSKSSETKGETIAGFGQATWKIIPELEAAAGARYSHETKDSLFHQPYVNPGFAAFFSTAQIAAQQTFNNWSPEATLTWKPVRDITVYAAYKTAYKSGGFSNSGIYSAFSPAPVEDFTFDPEKGRGFEVGIKTTLLDRQLRFNIGVYSYKFTNLQVDYFNPNIFAFQTYNAGAATTKGVEVEFEYAPRAVDGLSLHGSANYNRARYKDFLAPCWNAQTAAQGCTLTGPAGAAFQDLSGTPTSVAPLWTGTLGASYEAPIGGLVLGLSADARYSDSYISTSFGNPATKIGAYVNFDASIRLRTADDHWEAALIGKNLTNRFYTNGGGDHVGAVAGMPADQIGFASNPRTVQVQLTWRY